MTQRITFEKLYGQELVDMARWMSMNRPDKEELRVAAHTLRLVGQYLLESEGIHR